MRQILFYTMAVLLICLSANWNSPTTTLISESVTEPNLRLLGGAAGCSVPWPGVCWGWETGTCSEQPCVPFDPGTPEDPTDDVMRCDGISKIRNHCTYRDCIIWFGDSPDNKKKCTDFQDPADEMYCFTTTVCDRDCAPDAAGMEFCIFELGDPVDEGAFHESFPFGVCPPVLTRHSSGEAETVAFAVLPSFQRR